MLIDTKSMNEKHKAMFNKISRSHKILEERLNIALIAFKDTDINIQKWKIMERDSISYNDFYNYYKKAFPVEFKELNKDESRVKNITNESKGMGF